MKNLHILPTGEKFSDLADKYFGGKTKEKKSYTEGDMITAMGFASAIDNNMESDDKLKLCIEFIEQFKNK